jgi:CheY-like chemotaxis protein
MVIRGMLNKLGARFELAINGVDAVERFARPDSHFDLILMDCEMPVLDGYEAARQIRQLEITRHQTAVPIIALTAHAMREHQQKSLDAGMNGHLSKPIEINQLGEVLQRYLVTEPVVPAASARASS